MKHKKTISGLMILVSLALAGCNVGGSTSTSDQRGSDITSEDVTSISDDSSSDVSSGPIDEYNPLVHAYVIGTPAGLELMREHSDATFFLLNDIDMTDINWVPIPLFTGILRGFDYKIKNLTIEGAYSSAGFFDTINSAIITDIVFENMTLTIAQDEAVGAVLTRTAGVVAGTQLMTFDAENEITTELTNIHVVGDVVVNMLDDEDDSPATMATVGGFVGSAEGGLIITDSSMLLTGSGADLTGGLIGFVEGEESGVSISNSFVDGEIFATQSAGGLIGHVVSSSAGIRAHSYNKAVVTSYGGIAGGLIGSVNSANISLLDARNHGDVTFELNSDGVTGVGGLIGLVISSESVWLEGVYNSGNVAAPLTSNAGGFIGLVNFVGSLNIAKSYNAGMVQALTNVGGFVGHAHSVTTSLSNVYNDGSLTVGNMSSGTGHTIGGFFGRFTDSEFDVVYAYNNAEIMTPTHSAGGFIGVAYSSIVRVTFSLHLGNLTGQTMVGTFVGVIMSEDMTVNHGYYSAAIDNGQGVLPENSLVHGLVVARENINDAFFTDLLAFDTHDWLISDTSALKLPTLK